MFAGGKLFGASCVSTFASKTWPPATTCWWRLRLSDLFVVAVAVVVVAVVVAVAVVATGAGDFAV